MKHILFFLLLFILLLPQTVAGQDPTPPKPEDPKIQEQLTQLTAALTRISGRLTQIEKLVPQETSKQVQKRNRASWQALCSSKGMKLWAIEIDAEGKGTIVCR